MFVLKDSGKEAVSEISIKQIDRLRQKSKSCELGRNILEDYYFKIIVRFGSSGISRTHAEIFTVK